jgi:hypothetical protein
VEKARTALDEAASLGKGAVRGELLRICREGLPKTESGRDLFWKLLDRETLLRSADLFFARNGSLVNNQWDVERVISTDGPLR